MVKEIRDIKSISEKLFKAMLLIQIALIILYNILMLHNEVSYDSSTNLKMAIEMWEHKSFYVNNFAYATSLIIDTPIPLAALLYGITGNVFVSYGIASSIIMLLCLGALKYFLNTIEISKNSKYIIAILMTIPYSLGMLGYAPVTFWGPGYYSIRILMLFYSMGFMIKLYAGKESKNTSRHGIILLFLYFISGFSSGSYLLQSIILALVVFEAIIILKCDERKFYTRKTFRYIVLFAVASMCGIMSSKLLGIGQYTDNILLNNQENFFTNLKGYVLGIFDLFGGIPYYEDQSVISLSGIRYIANFIFVIIIFGSMGYFVKNIKKHKGKEIVIGLTITIFVVNAFVLILANTKTGSPFFEARYHLIPMLALFIFIGLAFDEVEKFNKYILYNVLVFGVVCFSIIGNYNYKSLFKEDERRQELKEFALELQDMGSELIICLGTDGVEPRIMNIYNPKLEFACILENGEALKWGNSTRYYDNAEYTGKVIVLDQNGAVERQPEYIRSRLEYVESHLGYDIYFTEDNIFDLISKMPEKGLTRDFMYTEGYVLANSELNEEGNLISNGDEGIILYGPYTKSKRGVYDIKLYYEVRESLDNEVGSFEIALNDGKEIIGTEIIEKDKNLVILKDIHIEENGVPVEYRVYEEEGTIIEITSIEIVKK